MDRFMEILARFHEKIDFEKIEFMGLGVDRWAHSLLIFFLVIVWAYFRRPKWGLWAALALIFFKEIFDLSMIAYYELPKRAQWLDTGWDCVAGFVGLGLAWFTLKWLRR